MSFTGENIKAYLDAKNVHYDYYEENENRAEAIEITYKCDNVDSVSVMLFIDEDGESFNGKCFSIAKVPEAKLMDVYVLLNELNYEYRWLKFYLDMDNEISASGDAILSEENAGAECLELVHRYVGIVDDVYPRIMKVIWA